MRTARPNSDRASPPARALCCCRKASEYSRMQLRPDRSSAGLARAHFGSSPHIGSLLLIRDWATALVVRSWKPWLTGKCRQLWRRTRTSPDGNDIVCYRMPATSAALFVDLGTSALGRTHSGALSNSVQFSRSHCCRHNGICWTVLSARDYFVHCDLNRHSADREARADSPRETACAHQRRCGLASVG